MGIKIILLFLIITHVVLLMILRRRYSSKRIIDMASLKISLYQKRVYISRSINLPGVLSGKNAKGI